MIYFNMIVGVDRAYNIGDFFNGSISLLLPSTTHKYNVFICAFIFFNGIRYNNEQNRSKRRFYSLRVTLKVKSS